MSKKNNFSSYYEDDEEEDYEYHKEGLNMKNLNFDQIDPEKKSLAKWFVYTDLLGLHDDDEYDTYDENLFIKLDKIFEDFLNVSNGYKSKATLEDKKEVIKKKIDDLLQKELFESFKKLTDELSKLLSKGNTKLSKAFKDLVKK